LEIAPGLCIRDMGTAITIDKKMYREDRLAILYLTGHFPPEFLSLSDYEKAFPEYVNASDSLLTIIEGIGAAHAVGYLDAVQIYLDRNPTLDMENVALQIQCEPDLFRKLQDEAIKAKNIRPTKPTEGSQTASVELRHPDTPPNHQSRLQRQSRQRLAPKDLERRQRPILAL
jgi:hypothetical protein